MRFSFVYGFIRNKKSNDFSLLLVILFWFPLQLQADNSSREYHPDVEKWLTDLRKKGLIVSEKERIEIEQHPRDTFPERDEILANYDELLREIQKFRVQYFQNFKPFNNDRKFAGIEDRVYRTLVVSQQIPSMPWFLNPPLEEDTQPQYRIGNDILNVAHSAIEAIFVEMLWPIWAGTSWTIDGTCKKPQDGNIACGHFVQRMMEAAGFNIETRPGMHMAFLASDEQVWSYGGYYQDNLKNYGNLEKYIHVNGPGVYIAGMSADWGHVLFAYYRKGQDIVFCHAGPSPGGRYCVTYEQAEQYTEDFLDPYLVHVVKLGRIHAYKWIQGKSYYPIKIKKYPGEISPPHRVNQVQNALKNLKYYNSTIDNDYGPITRSAIASFQRRNGLPVTLLPDDITLYSLNNFEDFEYPSWERKDGYRRVKNAEASKSYDIYKNYFDRGYQYPLNSIFIRVFKLEKMLEVWAASRSDDYHFKTYEFAFTEFSGQLGPKQKQGDNQIPEGCYYIDRFNPSSNFHLSLGINYPNSIDRNRAGSNSPGGDIFIHGSDVTIGCVPIGDENIEILYLLLMDARDRGIEKIPVHIYPYHFGKSEVSGTNSFPEDTRLLWADLEKICRKFDNSSHQIPLVEIENNRYILVD